MLLTTDEYRRGLVKWSIPGGGAVEVVWGEGEHRQSSSLMTDPEGSVPDVIAPPDASVNVRMNSVEALAGPVRVTWEHLVGAEIQSDIFDSEAGKFALAGIPTLGEFERLIVSVPYLQWGDGWIIRVGDVLAHFTTTLILERHQLQSIEHTGRCSTFVEEFSSHRLEGSFIEIVAPKNLGDHTDIAYAVLGLVGLAFGDAAIGDVVQMETLASTPGGTEYAVRYPQFATPSAPNMTLRMPIRPGREQLEAFDRLLSGFIAKDDVRNDCLLPLRWYERAVRTGNEKDQFLGAFVGLESLVGARAKRLGFESPIAKLRGDPRVPELLAPLRADYPEDQMSRLIGRLQNWPPSLLDRYDAVAADLALDDEANRTFRKAFHVRNSLFHGGGGTIEEELSERTVQLLERMLRTEVSRDKELASG